MRPTPREKPIWKGHTLCDSNSDVLGEAGSGCQGLEGGGMNRAGTPLRVTLWWWTRIITHLSPQDTHR